MATQWVILASVISLAFATMLREDPNHHQELLIDCCESEKLLPYEFKNAKKCEETVITELSGKDENARAQIMCKVLECTLEENKLLDEHDNSIKEQELKKIFLENAHVDAKAIMQAATDKCFEAWHKNSNERKNTNCESGAEDLFRCIMIEVFTNCPESMINQKLPKCQGLKTLKKSKK